MSGLVEAYGAKRIGGQEDVSNEKARLIYETLDKYSDVYRVVPDKAVRSRMNICFRVHGGDADKEKAFLAGAEKKGLLGLKGHRSVGGIRASNCKYRIIVPDNAKLVLRRRPQWRALYRYSHMLYMHISGTSTPYKAIFLSSSGGLESCSMHERSANLKNTLTNSFCATDNAVSLDGAKKLVAYLEEYAKA